MAIEWGGWAGHMRVGLEIRHDPYDTNTPSINVHVDWYVQADSTWSFGDAQRLNLGDVFDGQGWDFYNDMGPNAVKYIGTSTLWNQVQNYGGGPGYWMGALITGHYQGAQPGVRIFWNLPARPPNVPTAPPVSVTEVGATTARLNVWAADGRGSNIVEYHGVVSAAGGSFGSWSQEWYGDANRFVTGLQPATTYEMAARARNGVGWGDWGFTGRFTTGAVAPNAPGNPTYSNVGQTTATAAWTASSNNGGSAIIEYQLQIATDANFTQNVVNVGAGTNLNVALSKLTPGQRHYTRVRSRNGVGWSPYSGATSFVTLAGTPVIVSPLDGASLGTGLIDVTVEALGIAADRRITLEVATDSGFTANVRTVTLDTTGGASADNRYRLQGTTDTQFLANGTYYARARVTNLTSGYVTPWSATRSFSQSHTPSVQLQGPANGGTFKYAATTQFSWAFVDSAAPADVQKSYQLLIENNDTGAVVYDSGVTNLATTSGANVSTVSVALPASVKGVLLRWRVRVWDKAEQASAWTNYNVLRLADPPVVSITYPTTGLPVDTGNPTFKWTVAVPSGLGIASSKIVVREASTNAIVWEKTITGGAVEATPETTILLNEITYSVTIEVTDGGGLKTEASTLFTTQYVSPDPIIYTITASDVNDAGRVLIDWSGQAADSRLIAWRVYRRELPSNNWERIAEIPDANARMWADYLIKSGHVYMYTVTQLADRSGAILESPLGQRAKAPTLPTLTNRVLNPRAVNPGGASYAWFTQVLGGGSGSTTYLTNQAEAFPGGPTSYARATVATVGAGNCRIGTGITGPTSPDGIPVTPGQSYVASVYIRPNKTSSTRAEIIWYNASGSYISEANGAPASQAGGTFGRRSVTGIAPAGAAFARLYGRADNFVVNDYVEATAAQVVEGTALPDYFDGVVGGDATYSVKWTGTANQSTSERYETPFAAEAQIEQVEIENYWIIVEDYPEYTVKLTNVTSNAETIEYEDETFTIIGRGRHTDYGDRLGASGSLTIQIRQLERESQLRKKIEELRELRENYYLRTPFGRLYQVSLGNPGWTPIAGTAWAEMGDMTLPWSEVA